MCFSGEQSAFFAGLSVMGAGLAYYRFRNLRYSISILYFGSMELLQAVQYLYLAVPEDNYAMCKNPTNQFLTVLGFVHIAFQPVFVNMLLRSLFGVNSLKDRIERDLIHRMCLVAALWLLSRYVVAVCFPDLPSLAPRATKECPNYEWLADGYDAGIGWETPNLPGHSCTFKANTPSGHLAWAGPMYQATYFMPGVSLHLFLMIVPKMKGAVLLFVTGPLLASYISASNNEQAAIWCFYSTYQVVLGVVVNCFTKPAVPNPPPSKLHHAGDLGDGPLTYFVAPTTLVAKKVI